MRTTRPARAAPAARRTPGAADGGAGGLRRRPVRPRRRSSRSRTASIARERPAGDAGARRRVPRRPARTGGAGGVGGGLAVATERRAAGRPGSTIVGNAAGEGGAGGHAPSRGTRGAGSEGGNGGGLSVFGGNDRSHRSTSRTTRRATAAKALPRRTVRVRAANGGGVAYRLAVLVRIGTSTLSGNRAGAGASHRPGSERGGGHGGAVYVAKATDSRSPTAR